MDLFKLLKNREKYLFKLLSIIKSKKKPKKRSFIYIIIVSYVRVKILNNLIFTKKIALLIIIIKINNKNKLKLNII